MRLVLMTSRGWVKKEARAPDIPVAKIVSRFVYFWAVIIDHLEYIYNIKKMKRRYIEELLNQ